MSLSTRTGIKIAQPNSSLVTCQAEASAKAGHWLRPPHSLQIVLKPNRPKLHHAIHEAAQLEPGAFGCASSVIHLRYFRIAEVVGGDLRRARQGSRPHVIGELIA